MGSGEGGRGGEGLSLLVYSSGRVLVVEGNGVIWSRSVSTAVAPFASSSVCREMFRPCLQGVGLLSVQQVLRTFDW